MSEILPKLNFSQNYRSVNFLKNNLPDVSIFLLTIQMPEVTTDEIFNKTSF